MAQPTQAPDLLFHLETPQIGNQVAVSVTISDAKQLLSTRIIIPPQAARGLAQGLTLAAEKAEKTIVKPPSLIANA